MVTIETCFQIFLTRPIFGVGIGNFGWYLRHFVTSSLLFYVPCGSFQPNNFYMQILAEQGLVGVSVYFLFIMHLFRSIRNSIVKNDLIMFFPLCLILYLLIHNLTLTTFFSFQFWIITPLLRFFARSAHALVLSDVGDGVTAVGLWK